MCSYRPWPYAAKSIVQHEWLGTYLFVWVTFKFAMQTTSNPLATPIVHDVMPPLNLWLCKVNGVPKAVTVSAWVDEWTLKLTVPDVLALPDRVTLEYDGPDENLRITWDKQWEPWGAILSYRAMGAPYTGTKTHSAVGPTDDVNVTDVGVLFLDCSANDITIGGFVGGINGQILRVAKLCSAEQDVTLEHVEGTGNQDIHLHAGGDEKLRGEYGGWLLICNGSAWYDVSHAKHV